MAILLEPTSDFRDFYANMYKYASEVNIPGTARAENANVFEQIRNMISFLESVRSARELNSTHSNPFEEGHVRLEESRNGAFKNAETGAIDSSRIILAFEWSLNVWILLGDRYGRPPSISEADIPMLVRAASQLLK